MQPPESLQKKIALKNLRTFVSTHQHIFWLFLIIVLAAGMRFYRLNEIPPGLWYDEAIYAIDAHSVLIKGPQIFFITELHPREPLFMHIVALFFLFLSPSPLALRATSGIIGLLTVLLTYIFVHRATRNITLALLSTFFLATLRWHFHFSRTGFRTILVAPVVLLLLTHLLPALVQNNPRQRKIGVILSGFWLGIGTYTYLSFRLVPFIVLFVFVYAAAKKIISLKDCLRYGALLLLVGLIVFAPLLIDFIKNPFHFAGRTDEVSLFKHGIKYAIKSIFQNLLSVMLMFSIPGQGDHVAKHNIPYQPVLDLPSSLIFYLGLAIAIYRAVKHSDIFSATTIFWLVILLFASVLSYGAPNLLRTLGATPAVAILLSIGLVNFYSLLRRFVSKNVSLIVVGLIPFTFAILQAKQYFVDWYNLPKTWQEFNSNIVDLAKFIDKNIPHHKYFIYLPSDIVNHPSFRFLNKHPDVMPIQSLEQILCQQSERPHLILITAYGDLYRSQLLNHLPSLTLVQKLTTYGYGEWAYFYLLMPKDLLTPYELNSFLKQLNINPENLRLYF